jgi:hypothetical protein
MVVRVEEKSKLKINVTKIETWKHSEKDLGVG